MNRWKVTEISCSVTFFSKSTPKTFNSPVKVFKGSCRNPCRPHDPAATGLAGTAKFLLEAEEAACKCTTVCLLLSLTNWTDKSEYDRPESSRKQNKHFMTFFPGKCHMFVSK